MVLENRECTVKFIEKMAFNSVYTNFKSVMPESFKIDEVLFIFEFQFIFQTNICTKNYGN